MKKLFRNEQEKREFKKVLKGIKKLEISMKPETRLQRIKKKLKLFDEEKEIIRFIFKVTSIITYLAIIVTTIFCDDYIARWSILSYMIFATSFMVGVIAITYIVRRFDK